MPLYEYECESCGHRTEIIQRFSDPPLATCPECAGSVRRLISAPAVQFKGTGWYVTDYARKGRQAPAEKSAAKTESKAGESTSGEAKKKEAPAAAAADTD